MCAFDVLVTASGLQGQQPQAPSSDFPTGTAAWDYSLPIGSGLFQPCPLSPGLSKVLTAQEKLDESKLGPFKVSPQLLLALEENELETVAEKDRHHVVFPAGFRRGELFLQSTGKASVSALG